MDEDSGELRVQVREQMQKLAIRAKEAVSATITGEAVGRLRVVEVRTPVGDFRWLTGMSDDEVMAEVERLAQRMEKRYGGFDD
jgi:hypothetical protein